MRNLDGHIIKLIVVTILNKLINTPVMDIFVYNLPLLRISYNLSVMGAINP